MIVSIGAGSAMSLLEVHMSGDYWRHEEISKGNMFENNEQSKTK